MTTQRITKLTISIATMALALTVLSPVASAAVGNVDPGWVEEKGIVSEPSPNIVGGNEATPGEYPFAVDIELSIYASYSWYPYTYSIIVTKQCAGTLIDPEWVLTAAHCFNSVSIPDDTYPYGTFRGSVHVDDLELHIGRHDLTTTTGETFSAAAAFVHPDYEDIDKGPYDIALVRLDGTSAYSPVDLTTSADAGLYSGGTTATAIGWGHTSDGGSSSDVLLEVAIPTLSDTTCTTIHGADFFPSIELCAGDIYNGGEDTCQGDSGGPILVPGGSGWLQAGITSWGIGCATIVPGVYTEVAAYRDWIDDTMSLTPLVADRARHMSMTDSHLVYWIDDAGDLTPYSVSISGGEPTALGTPVDAYGSMPIFELTDDGTTLVYGVPTGDWPYAYDLFAVPVAGPSSSRVLLLDDFPWDDSDYIWGLSPDGTEVFYISDYQGDSDFRLWRAPTDGGDHQIVSGAMVQFGDVHEFDLTSDGAYAIFLADLETNGYDELWAAHLDTGAVSKISAFPEGDVDAFAISPDGSTAVYTASLGSTALGLFSIAVNGSPGNEVKIADGDPLPEIAWLGGALTVSPDSAHVVYERTDDSYDDHLYSTPISGPPTAEVELSAGMSWIGTWELTSDGQYVVIDGDVDFDDGLFSVPVAGPASALVNLNSSDYWAFDYAVSPRGDLVAYAPGDTDDLTLVPVAGPASAGEVVLSEYLLQEFMWSPTGSHLLYKTYGTGNKLFSVAVDGDRSSLAIAGEMQIDGGISWPDDGIPAISPNSGVVAFLADARLNEVVETWRVAMNGEDLGTAPTAVPDAYRVLAGAAYTSPAPGVLGNDTDPDGDTLTATLLTPPATGSVTLHTNGSFTYTRAEPGLETFAYTVSDGQWTSQPATVTVRTVAVPDYSTFDVMTGDFTGDGVDDVAAYDPATGNWTVGVIGSDFAHTVWATFSPSVELTTTLVGDFNGDGKHDLANYDASTGKWWISISTGTAFTTSAWMTFSSGIELSNQFVGDFNGDGVDDLANFEVTTGKWFVSLSLPDLERFATSQWSKFTASLELPSQFVGDFNGDGLDDLANYHLASGKWFISTSTGTSFATGAWMKFTAGTEFFSQFVGDFNGDGIDDLANYQIETGKWFISISNGNGGFATAIWSKFTPSIVISSQFIGDFNGDGMSDLANFEVTTGKWFISISTGNGRFLTSMWSKFTPSLVLDPQLIGDFNGDGLDDLLNCQMPIGKLWISQSTSTGFATASHGYLPY